MTGFDYERHRETLFKVLRESLQRLSMAEGSGLVSADDQFVAEFDRWLCRARPCLSQEQLTAIKRADALLDAIIAPAGLEVEDDRPGDVTWDEVREMAKTLLDVFGWRDEPPPPSSRDARLSSRPKTRLFRQLPKVERSRYLELFAENRGEHDWLSPEEVLDHWKETVKDCEDDYELGIDDYRHDLTVRELIEDILERAAEDELPKFRSAMSKLDAEFGRLTKELGEYIYTPPRADPEKYFFYYRVPRRVGDEMLDDLLRARYIPYRGWLDS